ncbi:ATP-binding protein [Patescibacteria group bacterium]|nr:ATP-binding protein [Patescibacteria group bacterium]
MIPRTLTEIITNTHKPGFINVVYGPRRVGKTVLLEQVKQNLSKNKRLLLLNGDTEEGRNTLSTTSEVKLSQLVAEYDYIFVDEAQRIPNITLALKILIDRFPQKFILVTGSSSLDLSRGMHENLTGRTQPFFLFPLSTKELSVGLERHQIPSLLENQLIYGGYPHLTDLPTSSQKEEYLMNIVEDYLFKDVLMLERIENPDNIKKLAILLAFQVGSLVSLNELSNALGIDIKTVARYLHLLEQSFVIFRVGSYSTNLRKELTKSSKYYFYDLGILNALTRQFLPLSSRIDVGSLWENFLFVERQKKQHYGKAHPEYNFWRNYEGAEIDMIERTSDKIRAFEFKWKESTYRTPKQFSEKYHCTSELITKENYLSFIT